VNPFLFSRQQWLSMTMAVTCAAFVPVSPAQPHPAALQSAPQTKAAVGTGPLREGTHLLSVQWISWDDLRHAGKAEVHKKDGDLYSIKGEQRSKDGNDFVTIDGTLKVTSPTELLFEGTIRTQVHDENDGKVCDKTGTYHFLSTQGRKYWRLQEMDTCDKSAVDYVDIFF
jgi:hypothetical protein